MNLDMNFGRNRFAAISFVVLLGSVTLAAQNPASSAGFGVLQAGSGVYEVPIPSDQNCPVSMHAQHGSGGGLVVTGKRQPDPDSRPSATAQRIHLTLGKSKNPVRVAGARVTVRGTNGKWRTMPTSSIEKQQSNATKTLDIVFGINENGVESTDMVLRGFTSVQSITLDSLTYADDSIWSPKIGMTCRTIPDPLMLVSAR